MIYRIALVKKQIARRIHHVSLMIQHVGLMMNQAGVKAFSVPCHSVKILEPTVLMIESYFHETLSVLKVPM